MSKLLDWLLELLKLFVLIVAIYLGLNLLSGAKISFEKPNTPDKEQTAPKVKPAPLKRIFNESINPDEEDELVGKISLGDYKAPDGTPVRIDFPLVEDIRNIGSRIDAQGMCVFSSIEMNSRWQNLIQVRGIRDWAANFPGGGYPKKVDKQIKQFCEQKGIPIPPYLQYQGNDLDVLRTCLKTYRIASVTYSGNDGVRYNTNIAHMVNLVHLDDKWAAIYDNNGSPGKLIWMSPAEFKQRWTGGRGDSGNGWAFFWLAPPPPPAVIN